MVILPGLPAALRPHDEGHGVAEHLLVQARPDLTRAPKEQHEPLE